MQFLTTTPLAFLLFFMILALGPVRGLWPFFLTMPLGASAAMNLSGLGSLSLTDFCVVALWMSILWRPVGFSHIIWTLKPGEPGFALLMMILFGTISAIFLPRVLSGSTEVYILAKRGEGIASVLIPLQPVGANISQIARLIIAASSFVLLATVFRKFGGTNYVVRAMILASSLHIFLSLLDVASHTLGFPQLLSFIRTSSAMMLDNQMMLGIKRMTGGFPEPSSFSYYTIGLYAFWLRYWFQPQSSRLAGFMLVAMGLLLIRSTSTAAYVCMGVFTILFFTFHVAKIARDRKAAIVYLVAGFVAPAVLGAFTVAYSFIPELQSLLDQILFSKASSHSGVQRMMWNEQALVNFYETYGLGTGIGSVRGSSWLTSTLGSMGIIGFGLYMWFIGSALTMRPPLEHRQSQTSHIAAALQCGAAAVFVQSLITKPYPNLEVPFFAMAGVAVGLLGYQARARVTARKVQPSGSETERYPETRASPL
jgi:hypothetical protein